MGFATKHDFSNAFTAQKAIEVPAPELGEDVVVRFKSTWSVNDMLYVVSVDGWHLPLAFDLLLARISLIDGDGNRLIDEENDQWFNKQADAVLLARLAKRANLTVRFIQAMRPHGDENNKGEGRPLTADRLKQTIADLSIAMHVSPEEVRKWPVQDLAEILRASSRAADRHKGEADDDPKAE